MTRFRRQLHSATRSPSASSRPPSGARDSSIASRCLCQPCSDSKCVTTGRRLRMPCLVALRLTLSLPWSVFGPVLLFLSRATSFFPSAMAEAKDEYFAYPLLKRGELTLLVGEAKFSGKTTLMFCALKSVLEREPFLGEETKFGKILYLSEQGNNLSRAVESSNINTDDEESFRVVQFKDVWREPWEDTIERAVVTAKEQDREILPVDTFSAFSHLKGSEENDAGAVASRLEPLKVAAQAHDLAVVLVHHSGRDSIIRGSSAFDGTVDTIVHLSRPPGNQNENLRHITAIGRCEPLSLNIELTEDGVYVPVGSSDRVAFTKAVRAIREVLPRRAGDALILDGVVDRVKESGADVSNASVERALRWLVDQGSVERVGAGRKGDP